MMCTKSQASIQDLVDIKTISFKNASQKVKNTISKSHKHGSYEPHMDPTPSTALYLCFLQPGRMPRPPVSDETDWKELNKLLVEGARLGIRVSPVLLADGREAPVLERYDRAKTKLWYADLYLPEASHETARAVFALG
jgi:hypothetical protein